MTEDASRSLVDVRDLNLVREALDACRGEDLRLNGCACVDDSECYLHAVIVPTAIQALDRMEAVSG